MKRQNPATLKKWAEEAEACGWELVEQVAGGSCALFRHKLKEDGTLCGGVQTVHAAQMQRGTVRCKNCQDPLLRWVPEALAHGWKLLRKIDPNWGEYQHLSKADGSFCGAVKRSTAAQMRSGKVRCSLCESPLLRWTTDAEAHGWELVRQIDGRRGEYQHKLRPDGNPCGATKVVQAGQMRLKHVRCDICQAPSLGWEQEAEKHGWRFISKADGNCNEYEHCLTGGGVKCGGRKIVSSANMRRGSVRCDTCQNPLTRWETEAAAASWELVEQVDGNRGRYRHPYKADGSVCGHVQVAQAKGMRDRSVRCGGCQSPVLFWKAEAEKIGWELLRQINGNSGEYRHRSKEDGTPCGAVKIAAACNIRKNNVRCDGCQHPLQRWAFEAKAAGWELLRQIDSQHGEYRHKCNAVRTARADHIRARHVRCKSCGPKKRVSEPRVFVGGVDRGAVERYAEEASAAGWEFMRSVPGRHGYGEYKHLLQPDGTPCGKLREIQMTHMRRGTVKCLTCGATMLKWGLEAEKVGWVLLRQLDGHRAEYQHKQKADGSVCGAVKSAHAAGMRKGSVQCDVCQDPMLRWETEAKLAGWFLLRQIDGSSAEYQHVAKSDNTLCGHKQIVQATHMRRGGVQCGGCESPLLKWEQEAHTAGWVLVRQTGSSRGEYQHRLTLDGVPCGHAQEADASHMRTGGVRCGKCQDPLQRWSEEAEKIGWQFLRQLSGSRGGYRHSLKPDGSPCGHVQEVDASHMRMKGVRCGKCGDYLLHWRVEAEEIGWELIRQTGEGKGEYKHKVRANGEPCGAIKTLFANSVSKKTVRCDVCKELKWTEEAEKIGWEFLRRVDSARGEYRHRNKADGSVCGAVKLLLPQAVKKNNVQCDACQDPILEWAEQAEKAGWLLLEKAGPGEGRYQHKYKPDGSLCGAVKTVAAASMRRRGVRCSFCGKASISSLHQYVCAFLSTLSPSLEENYSLGLKPALGAYINDGFAYVDFLVPFSTPYIVIEIDGTQHFKLTSRWHPTEDDFKRQVYRDVFVEQDAISQGMLVLRFASWEDPEFVKDHITKALAGQITEHRVAEQMPLGQVKLHENFWVWRAEGLVLYEQRVAL